jgi:hypothetical protein
MILRGTIALGELVTKRQRSGGLVVRHYSMEEFLHALAVLRLLEGEGFCRSAPPLQS